MLDNICAEKMVGATKICMIHCRWMQDFFCAVLAFCCPYRTEQDILFPRFFIAQKPIAADKAQL